MEAMQLINISRIILILLLSRKFLADILGKDADKKVLLRFADLLDKAEILNDGPDVEDSDSDDEGDDDNEWQ